MLSSEEDLNSLNDSPSQSLPSTTRDHPVQVHRIWQQIINEVADVCVLTRPHTWLVHLFASACRHRERCTLAKDTEHDMSVWSAVTGEVISQHRKPLTFCFTLTSSDRRLSQPRKVA